MIHRNTIFHPSDRYQYDMKLKAFAQIDTTEDAPYYGICSLLKIIGKF